VKCGVEKKGGGPHEGVISRRQRTMGKGRKNEKDPISLGKRRSLGGKLSGHVNRN